MRRILPPLTAAVLASATAVTALISDDAAVLRVIAVAATAVALGGAVLHAQQDRAAEQEMDRLIAARASAEFRADEQTAEAEGALEAELEGRERAERTLAARRAELAKLRGEHAELLRRYAVAESERAAALERARLAVAAEHRPAPLTSGAFREAAAALTALERRERSAEQPTGGTGERLGTPKAARAVAVVPPSRRATRRAVAENSGGFDFFGRAGGGASRPDAEAAPMRGHPAEPAPAPELAAANADLADVVGDEACAEASEGAEATVVDLTAHDETEPVDIGALRATS